MAMGKSPKHLLDLDRIEGVLLGFHGTLNAISRDCLMGFDGGIRNL